MYKHIKFSAEPIGPDFQNVKVVILEQTHIGGNFADGSYKFVHKDFAIHSSGWPENQPGRGPNGIDQVAMRGQRADRDGQLIILTTAQYAKFKATVEAYNKNFSTPDINSCAAIVG